MNNVNYFDFDEDMDSVLESSLEGVLEAEGHVIDPKTRDSLPDNAFGVVYTSDTERTKMVILSVIVNIPLLLRMIKLRLRNLFLRP